MLKRDQIDMYNTDFAVDIKNVSKVFTQWQRDNTKKGILKNLIKPEKRIIKALDNVSFNIKKGEFVAYAGPNGSGKSTTMKLLSGMIVPNAGEVNVLNLSPYKERCNLMKTLGVLFGNRTELWWDHPIIQSFEWKKVVWNIPDKEYKQNLNMIIDLLDMGDLLKTFVRELSLGQRMKADLALMLLHSPKLILLDEPTLGLDVVAKRQMIDFLKKINKENGVTIIVTSHDMDDLEEMAERILIVSKGKLTYDGDFNGLRKISGSLTRVTVTMNNNIIPKLNECNLVFFDKSVYEYEIDINNKPIKNLMFELSQFDGISDVEIKKAPIEKVIAKIYESLR